jgi:hypothetical protein
MRDTLSVARGSTYTTKGPPGYSDSTECGNRLLGYNSQSYFHQRTRCLVETISSGKVEMDVKTQDPADVEMPSVEEAGLSHQGSRYAALSVCALHLVV